MDEEKRAAAIAEAYLVNKESMSVVAKRHKMTPRQARAELKRHGHDLDDVNRVVSLRREGLPWVEIARRVGVSARTARDRFAESQEAEPVPTRARRGSVKDPEYIVSEWKKDPSANRIALKLGVHKETVYSYLRGRVPLKRPKHLNVKKAGERLSQGWSMPEICAEQGIESVTSARETMRRKGYHVPVGDVMPFRSCGSDLLRLVQRLVNEPERGVKEMFSPWIQDTVENMAFELGLARRDKEGHLVAMAAGKKLLSDLGGDVEISDQAVRRLRALERKRHMIGDRKARGSSDRQQLG